MDLYFIVGQILIAVLMLAFSVGNFVQGRTIEGLIYGVMTYLCMVLAFCYVILDAIKQVSCNI